MLKHLAIIAVVFCLVVSGCSQGEFSPKIGVCTDVGNADKVRGSGYDYVEEGVWRLLIPGEAEEKFLKKYQQFEASGFEVYACNSFIPGKLKSTGPDTKHDEIIAYVETAFRRAQMIGIKTIVFGSSGSRSIPKGFDRDKARGQFVELLKRMGPVAGKYGVVVSVEPLNRKETNFINSLGEGAEIVREVGHPNVRLLADLYHMAVEDESAEEIVKAGDLLYHCHIAEKVGRKAPGVNKYDFTPYFRALKEVGYKGRISVECSWDDFDKQLPMAIGYLREQIEAVNQQPD